MNGRNQLLTVGQVKKVRLNPSVLKSDLNANPVLVNRPALSALKYRKENIKFYTPQHTWEINLGFFEKFLIETVNYITVHIVQNVFDLFKYCT